MTALVVVLGIVAAALTALPPAAGAATVHRTATTVSGHKGSRPVGLSARSSTDLAAKASAETTVDLLLVEKAVPHTPRPPFPSSAALNASQKHAIRAAPIREHETYVIVLIVVPAQGPRAPPCAYEFPSRFTDAGGDPVNAVDPSGQRWAGPPDYYLEQLSPWVQFQWTKDPAQVQSDIAAIDHAMTNDGGWGRVAHAVANSKALTWFNTHLNPAYGILLHSHDAYELAQNPNSSNWVIADQADLAFVSAVRTVLTGLGGAGLVSRLSAGSVAAVDGTDLSALDRTGSALKNDLYHRAPAWVADEPGKSVFSITGGDGVTRTLYQLTGGVNSESGVFEWIVEETDGGSVIVHERFIPGGSVTGYPNQVP